MKMTSKICGGMTIDGVPRHILGSPVGVGGGCAECIAHTKAPEPAKTPRKKRGPATHAGRWTGLACAMCRGTGRCGGYRGQTTGCTGCLGTGRAYEIVAVSA